MCFLECALQTNQIAITDFNDLYVLAVGVCMAYIFIENNNKHSGNKLEDLFSFFQYVGDQLFALFARNLVQQLGDLDFLKNKVVYLKSHGFAANDILIEATLEDPIDQKIEEIQFLSSSVSKSIKKHTNATYLYVIAYDTFIYSLFICLFIGTLHQKGVLNSLNLIWLFITFEVVAIIHVLICEVFGDPKIAKWYKPNRVLHSIAIFLLFLCSIYADNNSKCLCPDCIINNLSIIMVATCYLGFITYIIYCFTASFSLVVFNIIKYPLNKHNEYQVYYLNGI